MFALLCLIKFSQYLPRDWLVRASPKWSILCWVGWKTWSQWISQSSTVARLWHWSYTYRVSLVFCSILAEGSSWGNESICWETSTKLYIWM